MSQRADHYEQDDAAHLRERLRQLRDEFDAATRNTARYGSAATAAGFEFEALRCELDRLRIAPTDLQHSTHKHAASTCAPAETCAPAGAAAPPYPPFPPYPPYPRRRCFHRFRRIHPTADAVRRLRVAARNVVRLKPRPKRYSSLKRQPFRRPAAAAAAAAVRSRGRSASFTTRKLRRAAAALWTTRITSISPGAR